MNRNWKFKTALFPVVVFAVLSCSKNHDEQAINSNARKSELFQKPTKIAVKGQSPELVAKGVSEKFTSQAIEATITDTKNTATIQTKKPVHSGFDENGQLVTDHVAASLYNMPENVTISNGKISFSDETGKTFEMALPPGVAQIIQQMDRMEAQLLAELPENRVPLSAKIDELNALGLVDNGNGKFDLHLDQPIPNPFFGIMTDFSSANFRVQQDTSALEDAPEEINLEVDATINENEEKVDEASVADESGKQSHFKEEKIEGSKSEIKLDAVNPKDESVEVTAEVKTENN